MGDAVPVLVAGDEDTSKQDVSVPLLMKNGVEAALVGATVPCI